MRQHPRIRRHHPDGLLRWSAGNGGPAWSTCATSAAGPRGTGRRLRTHAVLRSGTLAGLSSADSDTLNLLGLRTVYDLRSAAERDRAPDRVPEGAALVPADVFADDKDSAAAQLPRLATDPTGLAAALGNGAGVEMLKQSYRDMVRLPSACTAYGWMLQGAALGHPILFHCTAGKDRTGWGAAVLLMLLGVDEHSGHGRLSGEQGAGVTAYRP